MADKLRSLAALGSARYTGLNGAAGYGHPEYTPTNLVDSFLSGVDQVTIALLHPFWPGEVPIPGVAGRWIIAFALLLGYRQLERWALHWQAPELDLSAIGRGRPTRVRCSLPA